MSETGGMSGFVKLLIGCAIGFGLLIMLAVGSCVGFAVWMSRPGALVEPARLTGSETVGVLNCTLRLEDPGTEQFLARVFEGLQALHARAVEKDLPPIFRTFSQLQTRHNEAKLRAMLPIEAGVVIEPGGAHDPSAPRTLCYLSLKGAGNRIVFVGWVMGLVLGWTSRDPSFRYGGERILPLTEHGKDPEDAPAVFLRGNDIFLTSGLALARTAVDRLNAGGVSHHPPARLEALIARVSAGSPIRGAILNDRGELASLLTAWFPEGAVGTNEIDLFERARQVTIEGGFQPDRSLVLDVAFECGEPECHRRLQALATAPAASPAGAGAGHAVFTLSYASEGTIGRIRARCPDPAASIAAWFTSLDPHANPSPDP